MSKWLLRGLRASIIMFSFIIFVLAVFWLPEMAKISAELNPEVAYLKYPVLFGMYLTCIPFFTAVFHTFKLTSFINRESAFTEEACKSLGKISYSGLGIIILYIIGILYIDNARALSPGMALMGIIIIFASASIATFAAVLKALLMKVIDIKTENELTI